MTHTYTPPYTQSYMHGHGIVHRDLKYENVLFEDETPMANIKVIDFGLSKKFKTGVPGIMTERVGTMYVRCRVSLKLLVIVVVVVGML